MKPDWIIHYILDAWPSSHTHGLSRYGGLELEVNLPVSQEYVAPAFLFFSCLGAVSGKTAPVRPARAQTGADRTLLILIGLSEPVLHTAAPNRCLPHLHPV